MAAVGIRLARARRSAGELLPHPVIRALDRLRVQQAALCGVLTTRPAAFTLGEVGRRPGLRRYRLRDSGLAFCVHHGTEDLGVVDEVFRLRHYAFPARVAAHLEALERPRVVDLGAHIGLFGVAVLERFPAARIVAYEPDPINHEALRCCIHANGRQDRWRAIQACAAARDGSVRFAAGRSSGSQVVATAAEGAIEVPALDVFGDLERADLLKMDMEGGEWELLDDSRFDDIAPAAMVLEYHPHLCPGPDPRARVERTLTRKGYEIDEIFHHPSGVGMMWAIAPTT